MDERPSLRLDESLVRGPAMKRYLYEVAVALFVRWRGCWNHGSCLH